MAGPVIKLISLSNVYTRLMYFTKKGDVEEGHKHMYDHATLVSSGSVLYEVLDDNGVSQYSKVFTAPDMVYVDKNKFHRITALEDGTTCGCIHALRDIQDEIIPPDSFISPHTELDGDIHEAVEKITGKQSMYFNNMSIPKPNDQRGQNEF